MTEEIYDALADWLSTTFRGQPGIKSPELMELLRHQYTPGEAKLVVDMGYEGGRIDALVEKVGMTRDQMMPLIKSMERKGTLYTEPGTDDPFYRPFGMESLGIIETAGWGENSSPFKRKLNQLWYEFKPIYVNEGIEPIGKLMMAWCHVDVLPEDATPEENLFGLLKAIHGENGVIAVADCPCRVIDQHGENAKELCDCVMECCFCFGDMARWAIENGWARSVTVDETIEILKEASRKGQVHTGLPVLILCNCCHHACINFYARKLDKDHAYFRNHFYASADPELCMSCHTCADRCASDAIQHEPTSVIDIDKCIGCGSCATACPEGAIKMNRKSKEEIFQLDQVLLEAFQALPEKVSPSWS